MDGVVRRQWWQFCRKAYLSLSKDEQKQLAQSVKDIFSGSMQLWQYWADKSPDGRKRLEGFLARFEAQKPSLHNSLDAVRALPRDSVTAPLWRNERVCIRAARRYQRLLSLLQEWRHLALQLDNFPYFCITDIDHMMRHTESTLHTEIYIRYRLYRAALGPPNERQPPSTSRGANLPKYVDRISDQSHQQFPMEVLWKQAASSEYPATFNGKRWCGAWPIGAGGQGSVSLWVELDGAGQISDRAGIKDTYVRTNSWARATDWSGNVTDVHHRVPMEVKVMQRLQAAKDCIHVAKLRHWTAHWDRYMYRMFMPFYEYRDLGSVCQHYFKVKDIIPESFVWRVFEALVEAGLAMEMKTPESDGKERREIVHRDLKADNVFLTGHPTEVWTSYPTPVLGDFGLAIITSKSDTLNPYAYIGAGTRGYFAPEQTGIFDTESLAIRNESFRLTTKTNVWAVGKTLFNMMTLEHPQKSQPLYCKRKQSGNNGPGTGPEFLDYEPIFSPGACIYSKELRNLVKHCLAYEPKDRPRFRWLLGEIRSYTDGDITESEDDSDDDENNHDRDPDENQMDVDEGGDKRSAHTGEGKDLDPAASSATPVSNDDSEPLPSPISVDLDDPLEKEDTHGQDFAAGRRYEAQDTDDADDLDHYASTYSATMRLGTALETAIEIGRVSRPPMMR